MVIEPTCDTERQQVRCVRLFIINHILCIMIEVFWFCFRFSFSFFFVLINCEIHLEDPGTYLCTCFLRSIIFFLDYVMHIFHFHKQCFQLSYMMYIRDWAACNLHIFKHSIPLPLYANINKLVGKFK